MEKMELEKVKIANEERQREREFKLEELRLTQGTERSSSRPSNRSDRNPKLNIKTIMHTFEPEKSNITLFLNLFERQAERLGIEIDEFVIHLLALLPIDIAEFILREPIENVDNFSHERKILLARYRLGAEAYRLKIMRHQKKPSSPWKDLIFELNSFQEGWLDGLGIKSLEELKDLLIRMEL